MKATQRGIAGLGSVEFKSLEVGQVSQTNGCGRTGGCGLLGARGVAFAAALLLMTFPS